MNHLFGSPPTKHRLPLGLPPASQEPWLFLYGPRGRRGGHLDEAGDLVVGVLGQNLSRNASKPWTRAETFFSASFFVDAFLILSCCFFKSEFYMFLFFVRAVWWVKDGEVR